MSYELSFRHDPNYLYVKAKGIRTAENLIAMSKDILAVRDKHGYNKALIDVREMTGGLGIVDAYKLGTKDFQEYRRPGQLKVSIVDLEHNRERFQFIENVAVNMGLNLRIFSEVDEALTWLGVGKSTASE
jgi:hypothetical protein